MRGVGRIDSEMSLGGLSKKARETPGNDEIPIVSTFEVAQTEGKVEEKSVDEALQKAETVSAAASKQVLQSEEVDAWALLTSVAEEDLDEFHSLTILK